MRFESRQIVVISYVHLKVKLKRNGENLMKKVREKACPGGSVG